MYILRTDIHMVKKHLMKTCQGRRAFRRQGEELADIEYHYIAEVDLTLFIHTYKGAVYDMSTISGAKGKNAFASAIYKLRYVFGDFICDKFCAL